VRPAPSVPDRSPRVCDASLQRGADQAPRSRTEAVAHTLTTASNELEADIILSRLEEAGIHGWESNSLGGRPGSVGPRDIYVDDAELEQARRVLKEAQEVDAAELDRLADPRGADEES
jgi:hypothetical protein